MAYWIMTFTFFPPRVTWAPILHAASIWFSQGGGLENISAEKVELDVTGEDIIDLFGFIQYWELYPLNH